MSGSLLLSMGLKLTIVLAVGLGTLRLARGSRAAVRHVFLLGLFGAALALPVVSLVVPTFDLVLPYPATAADAPLTTGLQADAAVSTRAVAVVAPIDGTASDLWSLSRVLLAAESVGTLLMLTPLVVALWQTRRLCKAGRPWSRGQTLVDRLACDSGVRRRVSVLIHDPLPGPVTCGVRRPVILFPSDVERWSESDLARAAIHELEHVRRLDWMTDCVARAICALYWFHPLIWSAWRQLRLESERAADDAVVRDAEATAYAHLLVAQAQRIASSRIHVLAMASRRDLRARIESLLDGARPRGRAGRRCVALTVLAAAGIVFGVAPMRAVGRVSTTPTDQRGPGTAPRVSPDTAIAFEVASIKLNTSGDARRMVQPGPNGLNVTNLDLNGLIMFAYDIQPYQFEGGSGWMSSVRFDVSARLPTSLPAGVSPTAASRLALQTLLADRFKLVLHREPREVPALALVIARADRRLGPRLRPSNVDCSPAAVAVRASQPVRFSDDRSCGVRMSVNIVRFVGQPLAEVARWLGPSSATDGRLLVDATGLTGVWDGDLTFTPHWRVTPPPGEELPPIDPNGPGFAAAMREQWGLKFESTTAPITVLVVDSAEQPSAN